MPVEKNMIRVNTLASGVQRWKNFKTEIAPYTSVPVEKIGENVNALGLLVDTRKVIRQTCLENTC